MVKCEVLEKFTLGNNPKFKFEDLIELQRKDINKDNYNVLYVGDRFICNDEMALYLSGKNPINKVVVKAIEVTPNKPDTEKVEIEEPTRILEISEIKEVPAEEAKEIVKRTRGRKKKEDK